MRHTADARVHARSAQRLGICRLPDGALYEIRTAQPHEAGSLHHDDHVTQSAGRYAPPAMHGPITAEICGTRSFRRISEL